MKAFFQKVFSLLMSFFLLFAGLFQGGSGGEQKPTVTDTPVKSFQNLAYGSDPSRQILDLELPETDGKTSLVLFIHGGAWIFGGKDVYKDNLPLWKKSGYAAATMNYRYLSDTVHMNDELDDIGAALARIKEVAAANGNEITKVLLTGMSAGGHLSLLYAYARKDSAPITPAAVVSFCGPTDLTRADFLEENYLEHLDGMLNLMVKACGVPITVEEYTNKTGNYEAFMAALRTVSPISYASSAVPTVFAQGELDPIVPPQGVKDLSAALTAAGIQNDFVSYPNSGHDLADDPDSALRTNELFVQYALDYLN